MTPTRLPDGSMLPFGLKDSENKERIEKRTRSKHSYSPQRKESIINVRKGCFKIEKLLERDYASALR